MRGINGLPVHLRFSLQSLTSMGTTEQKTAIMQNRFSVASLLLAGAAICAAPVAAQADVHHLVGHPHAAVPHVAVHVGPVHAAVRPAFHPAFRAGVRGGPARGFAHFGRPGFRPLHAAIIGHVGFAHFSPAERLAWTHGRWYHRFWHGRYGWWWYAGGAWFWYNAPVYPYPTDVSDYYYEEPDYNEPAANWYYCYNPPGYYPYVSSCYGPWQPVPAEGYGGYDQGGPDQGGPDQGGPDQGPPPDDQQYGNGQPPPGYYNQGPPPGYNQGPPPGYNQGLPQGYDQGPPPGYNDQGPPPGYNDQGPPPGYDQGPPPGYNDQGPPPGAPGTPNNQQGHQ